VDAGATLQVPESLGLTPSLARPRAITGWTARGTRYLTVGVVGALLAISSGVTLYATALMIGLPQQLDEGEPLIYALAGRILRGESLYRSVSEQPFVQVHYTPVYYYAVAALRLVSSGFAPGRLLSVLSGAAVCAAIAYLVARNSGSWYLGGLAPLMFLGLGFPGGPAPFLGLERVDMLAVALSTLAIAVLARGTAPTDVRTAGVLAGLALLTKQSQFAAAAAGGVWLLTRDRRAALSFGVTAAATVLVPSALLELGSSGSYWDNIGPANPSPTSFEFATNLFKELVVTQGVPVLLTLGYILAGRNWRAPGVRLVTLYWFASAIPVIGIVKAGSNRNYWIEFAAATSVVVALSLSTFLSNHHGRVRTMLSWVPILLLAAQLAFLAPARLTTERSFDPVPLSWSLYMDPFERLSRQASGFNNLVRAVAHEDGVILAESADVVALGGHPVAFEPFAFSMLEEEGRWDSAPLVDDICSGRISLLVLSYPLESDSYPVGLQQFPMWPRSVMAALRHAMQLSDERDWHWLYRPLPATPSSSAACASAAMAARDR
jgi:hypothetical protein